MIGFVFFALVSIVGFVDHVLAKTAGGLKPPGILSEISLNGQFAAAYFSEDPLPAGGHDPQETGFTIQNLELAIGSVVDPFFRADANLVFLIEDGESVFELEEAYLTTLALPGGLQFLGGQFFTRFGRHNPTHSHVWAFADQPVVMNRFFGDDGLRNPGIQVSWLAPSPFYLEFIGSLQNASGETAGSFLSVPTEESGETFAGHPILDREVRHFDDLISMARIQTAVTPTDQLEAISGVSVLVGPNGTGPEGQTVISGLDFYGKWRPNSAEFGYPFASLGGELLWRRYRADESDLEGVVVPSNIVRDWGAYVQALWGIRRGWVAGGRIDYARGEDEDDPLWDRRARYSANLTFFPSEFSKWRLQYNLDRAAHRQDDPAHAVFLQWEFLIGSHAAHRF